jgi:very-short-patch-repair endonuclease
MNFLSIILSLTTILLLVRLISLKLWIHKYKSQKNYTKEIYNEKTLEKRFYNIQNNDNKPQNNNTTVTYTSTGRRTVINIEPPPVQHPPNPSITNTSNRIIHNPNRIIPKFIITPEIHIEKKEINKHFIAKNLMTENEKEFYQRLKDAAPHLHIFPQVALNAIITTKNNNEKNYVLRNKFSQKVADYVITDGNFRIIAIIELDDKTHNNKKEKDAERDRMIKDAGYNIIRYESTQKPTQEKIRNDLIKLLQIL